MSDAAQNHVPVVTGGVGREALRDFYSRRFIPKMPLDTETVPVCGPSAPTGWWTS